MRRAFLLSLCFSPIKGTEKESYAKSTGKFFLSLSLFYYTFYFTIAIDLSLSLSLTLCIFI